MTRKPKARIERPAEDWIPRKRGVTYCSPACGAGCTWGAFRTAKKKARALAVKMGPGWAPVVWENMAWHWCAEIGPDLGTNGQALARVSVGSGRSATCYINTRPQFLGDGRTPREAFADATKRARLAVAGILEALEVVSPPNAIGRKTKR